MEIDNIITNTNDELGDLDLFEQIDFAAAGDNVNNAKKLYLTSVEPVMSLKKRTEYL